MMGCCQSKLEAGDNLAGYGYTEVGSCDDFFQKSPFAKKRICANCQFWFIPDDESWLTERGLSSTTQVNVLEKIE